MKLEIKEGKVVGVTTPEHEPEAINEIIVEIRAIADNERAREALHSIFCSLGFWSPSIGDAAITLVEAVAVFCIAFPDLLKPEAILKGIESTIKTHNTPEHRQYAEEVVRSGFDIVIAARTEVPEHLRKKDQ